MRQRDLRACGFMTSPPQPQRRVGTRPRAEIPSQVRSLRFTSVEWGRLQQAARMNFTTPSDFVRSAALLAVDDTVENDALKE